MSVNSSSSSNGSLLHSNISSISSEFFLHICYISKIGSSIFIPFNFTFIFLLLPLCIFIIYHGLQQWRQKRSTSSVAIMSHSDSFAYNMVTMELIRIFGCILYCCGAYSHVNLLHAGFILFSFTWYGEMFFHILTCVERYLAVVHPITYLSLRKERGIRIRNVTIGCVWLLCFVGVGCTIMGNLLVVVDCSFLILSFTIVSFCSVSVLCVLIRPGPGEHGGGRKRVDQSKKRAFYTIMVILGVLVMRISWNLVWSVLSVSGTNAECLIMTSGIWFNLPSALVLPLLFLHRAGRLVCCKTASNLNTG